MHVSYLEEGARLKHWHLDVDRARWVFDPSSGITLRVPVRRDALRAYRSLLQNALQPPLIADLVTVVLEFLDDDDLRGNCGIQFNFVHQTLAHEAFRGGGEIRLPLFGCQERFWRDALACLQDDLAKCRGQLSERIQSECWNTIEWDKLPRLTDAHMQMQTFDNERRIIVLPLGQCARHVVVVPPITNLGCNSQLS